MKSGGIKVELQLLRNNASAFKKSAERSLEQRQLINGQIEFYAVPAAVNLAFSIELYLKYLLTKNSKNKKPCRGHNLLDLFNSLDSTIKQEIVKITGYNEEEFKILLSKHAEAFVEWRYIYERNKSISVNIEFMRKLIDCVESVVNRS